MTSSNAVRVTHSFVQVNDATPEKVFPLLCPVREAEWVPGWQYRMVYSCSGVAELDCVFVTPEQDGGETIWQCTEYDPEGFAIVFAWVRPEVMTAQIRIRLEARTDGKCDTHITYSYTALSEHGAAEVRRMNQAWFEQKMKSWQTAINHYLHTGKLIDAGGWE